MAAAAVMASGLRDAVEGDDAAASDFAADIALEFAASAFELGLEADDEASRSDLADVAVVEVDIAEAEGVAFIPDGATALTDGIAAQGAVVIVAATTVAIMAPAAMIDMMQMRAVAGCKRQAGVAPEIDRDGGAGAGLGAVGVGRRRDGDRGRSQRNGRRSRGHDAFHHACGFKEGLSNRA